MPAIVIYPKQAALLLNTSPSAACRLFHRIRRRFGKARRDLVSIHEFCTYTGLAEWEVRAAL